ncbi:hypothetical protein HanHA300_Chr05g0172181 [Helianthus annuus]|nr:hypothetical protein HanHA300_Chr05g0172181 [Helianthus annuus]KAJ0584255.1 hypothetical protein HanHA89_Chr05g0186431 [Helianthus annuus]
MLRYAESCKILIVQIHLCPRGRARWTRAVWNPMLTHAFNEGREKAGYGGVPAGHGVVARALCRL